MFQNCIIIIKLRSHSDMNELRLVHFLSFFIICRLFLNFYDSCPTVEVSTKGKGNTRKGFAVISSHCKFSSNFNLEERPSAEDDRIMLEEVLKKYDCDILPLSDKTSKYYKDKFCENSKFINLLHLTSFQVPVGQKTETDLCIFVHIILHIVNKKKDT